MDSYNISNIKRIALENNYHKIYKLLDFTGSGKDVSDPWYTRNFEVCYNDIYNGCMALLEKIKMEI